jgi:GTP-binding protein HflX
MREEQKTQVERVLAELGVSTKPVIQILNKVDLVPPQELAHLSSGREAVPVSSLQHTGLEQVLIAIDAALVADPLVEVTFRLPQSEGSILASLEGGALINDKRFEGNLVLAGTAVSGRNTIFLTSPQERSIRDFQHRT